MLRLQNYPWDVQVLSVLKRFIDPRFQNFGRHLYLPICRLEPGAFDLRLLLLAHFMRRLRIAKSQVSSIVFRPAILTVNVLSKLLCHNRDIQEALERRTF